jgi:hypothetical protein
MKQPPLSRPSAPSIASIVSIASQALAALVGGYALASSFTAFFSLALPLPPSEAVLAASLAGFAVHGAAAVFVFAARDTTRAWAGMLGPALVLAAGTWLLWSAR